MRLTRRTFIMASGAAAGWTLSGCAALTPRTPLHSALVPYSAEKSSPAQGDWVATACQGCTQWCAVKIFVQDGRAVRVRGNQSSKTNHGYVCARGHLIPQMVYDPDRIKGPMKRNNPVKGRGIDPKFVPISWDEAMNTVADRMIELRKAGEAHKLVYMRGRYHRTLNGLQPACVEVCPAKARIFGDQEDPASQISQLLKSQKTFRLQEDKGTKPNVHYIGKYSARA